MNVHAIDSELYKGLYGNEQIRNIFSDEQLLKHWIDIELALAQAQAELGIIPIEAFAEIKRNSKVELFSMEEIRRGIKDTSHPLITFIRILERNCEDGYGEYVHFGATTQDIMDTGLILQLKAGYEVIHNQLVELIVVLKRLTKETRSIPAAGRTHGQHALPITFGFKLATWVAELGRHLERMDQLQERVFVGQLAGATGTLASITENGLAVQERVMEILGLSNPTISWHTSRDNLVELMSVYGMIAGTVGKMANEIINLQRTEIAELEEGFVNGKVGSSTMPHKRNPMVCEYIVGLSRLVRLQMPTIFDSLVQEHERDMGLWLVEWEVCPEISIYVSKMIEDITSIIQNIIVREDQMAKNLHLTGGLIVSEKMMFVLSPHVGKQTAHDIIYQICMKAFETNQPVKDMFLQSKEVMKHLTKEEIESALEPANYVGLSVEYTDRVLKEIETRLGE